MPSPNHVCDIYDWRELVEEKGAIRRVRDVEYWGRPYGTIITPGMKPTGPKSPFGRAQRIASGNPVDKPTVRVRKPVSETQAESYLDNPDVPGAQEQTQPRDIIQNNYEMNARQNRYAIDNGWIDSSSASDNPRKLKAVLAERLWERLVLDGKKVSTDELVSLIDDPSLPSGDVSGNTLRFIISGSEEDYRAMKAPQISKIYNYSNYPEETAREVDRLVAVLPQKDFHVFVDKDGILQISERKHVEGMQDMLGREPFPVGTKEAEMLVGQYVIGRLIATWAGTSNDDSVLSLAAQEAIREEFNLKKTANWRRTHDYDFYKRHGLTLRKFVRAQHEETQKIFEDMNIGQVIVYRGIGVNIDDPILENADAGWMNPVPVEVVSRPASSWSTKFSTAKMFADDHAEPGTSEAVIFRTIVKAEEVLSTPLSGFGCWDEKEVVVLGGSRDSEMLLSVNAVRDTWGDE